MKDNENMGFMPKKIDIVSMKRRKPEFVSLASAYPKVAAEWHYEANKNLKDQWDRDISTPDKISYSSGRKVRWKCEHGHEWVAAVCDRTKGNGTGCPICSNRQVLIGFNDLATTHPQLAKQWHPTKNGALRPTDVTGGTKQTAWWIGVCGHEWETKILIRARDGSNCPYCANQKLLVGFNDLATTHPHLIEQWHPTKNGKLKPTDVVAGSTKKNIWWLGECGHEWESRVHSRVKGSGCPYCTHHKILPGFNDLATTHPHLIKEWHSTLNGSLQPIDVSRGSVNKVWWICDNGHTYESRVNTRTKGSGCPHCNNSRGENEIANILTQQNVVFRVQNVFSDRIYSQKLRDDFAILKNDHVIATIEYNGIQHYEPVDFAGKGDAWAKKQLKNTQARDVAKSKYLYERGSPQLIIPYWEFDNIPTLVQNFISTL